jgi:hypothetical protein
VLVRVCEYVGVCVCDVYVRGPFRKAVFPPRWFVARPKGSKKKKKVGKAICRNWLRQPMAENSVRSSSRTQKCGLLTDIKAFLWVAVGDRAVGV